MNRISGALLMLMTAALVATPVDVAFAATASHLSPIARYWFAKLSWQDPESYWKRSPLSLVGNVVAPTLIIVGAEDFRSPGSEAEQYYQALQLTRVPTALIRVPGATGTWRNDPHSRPPVSAPSLPGSIAIAAAQQIGNFRNESVLLK